MKLREESHKNTLGVNLRLMAKLERNSECLLWTKSFTYGHLLRAIPSACMNTMAYLISIKMKTYKYNVTIHQSQKAVEYE